MQIKKTYIKTVWVYTVWRHVQLRPISHPPPPHSPQKNVSVDQPLKIIFFGGVESCKDPDETAYGAVWSESTLLGSISSVPIFKSFSVDRIFLWSFRGWHIHIFYLTFWFTFLTLSFNMLLYRYLKGFHYESLQISLAQILLKIIYTL